MTRQLSSESQFSHNCLFCHGQIANLTLPICIKKTLYQKQSNFHYKYRKTIRQIIYGQPSQTRINYKQAIFRMFDGQLNGFKFKDIRKVYKQIQSTIINNVNLHHHYDKVYFGADEAKVMMKYKQMKKGLLHNNGKNNQYQQPKFKINKSSLSTDSQDKILLNSFAHKKFDFYPVQQIQKSKSKIQNSLFQIQKLKRNLSIMIQQIKFEEIQYPQIKNMYKPYVDFNKTKQQLKFRKRLQQNISEIHQQKNKKEKKSNLRLYTSPDPGDQSFNQQKYAQAYGFLFQNPQLNKKKSKKSFTKRQFSRQKILGNNSSRAKLMSSRQATQNCSQIIIKNKSSTNLLNMNIQKSKSKSKLKTKNSSNNLLLATSSSRNKIIKCQKSLNKSKKMLGGWK